VAVVAFGLVHRGHVVLGLLESVVEEARAAALGAGDQRRVVDVSHLGLGGVGIEIVEAHEALEVARLGVGLAEHRAGELLGVVVVLDPGVEVTGLDQQVGLGQVRDARFELSNGIAQRVVEIARDLGDLGALHAGWDIALVVLVVVSPDAVAAGEQRE
jgi:hypothetical protein